MERDVGKDDVGQMRNHFRRPSHSKPLFRFLWHSTFVPTEGSIVSSPSALLFFPAHERIERPARGLRPQRGRGACRPQAPRAVAGPRPDIPFPHSSNYCGGGSGRRSKHAFNVSEAFDRDRPRDGAPPQRRIKTIQSRQHPDRRFRIKLGCLRSDIHTRRSGCTSFA